MSDGPQMTREQFTELVATLDESLKAYARDFITTMVQQAVYKEMMLAIKLESESGMRTRLRRMIEERISVIVKLDGKEL